jgi:hypothetical protein
MLEKAQNGLASALQDGNDWEVGYAHLEVAQALLRESADWQAFQEDAQQALSQADQALEVFSGISHPGGIASALLAQASIYTKLADGEEEPLKKVDIVEQALSACRAAQSALNAEGVNNGQIFDIFSSTSVLLLMLRGMIDHLEYQEQVDELITSTSTALGEIVAQDFQLREEGDSILLTAQILGTLAELEEDQGEREELQALQGLLALQAGHWLEDTSDPDLIEQAVKTYQTAWAELEGEKPPTLDSRENDLICTQCGSTSPSEANFCNQCGASLKEGNR